MKNEERIIIEQEHLEHAVKYFNDLNEEEYVKFTERMLDEQEGITSYFALIKEDLSDDEFMDVIDYSSIIWYAFELKCGKLPIVTDEMIVAVQNSIFPEESEIMKKLGITDEATYHDKLDKFTDELSNIKSEKHLKQLSDKWGLEFDIFYEALQPMIDSAFQPFVIDFLMDELDSSDEENSDSGIVYQHIYMVTKWLDAAINETPKGKIISMG